MPGKRSNYSLLSQFPDDQLPPPPPQHQSKFSVPLGASSTLYESVSGGDKNKVKNERAFDWEPDPRVQQSNRIMNLFPSIGLQRQSSGSSFGESSLSGEYYVPTLSMMAVDQEDALKVNGGDAGGELRMAVEQATAGGSSSSKSWAQQTEESYQLQQALALRLSSEATCADDPNFLDPVPDESASRSGSVLSEAMSHRFWVNGCLSYSDKIPDGFYLIHGMDSYVWTVCADLQESGRIPSLESLKSMDPSFDSSVEVVLIDQRNDPSLKELQNRFLSLSCSCSTTKEVVDQLAKLVCNRMGGPTSSSTGEDEFVSCWRDFNDDLKECLGSVVFPIGNMSVGLCRHRAVLFKVLADTIDLPCRIAKGCKYCKRDDASSCLVRFALDREYLVDLMGRPGCLYEPDSLLNGPSSILISSPLRFPRFKPVEPIINFRSLAKQYFSDCQQLNLVFDDALPGGEVDGENAGDSTYPKHLDRSDLVLISNNNNEIPQLSLPPIVAWPSHNNRESGLLKSFNPSQDIVSSVSPVQDPIPSKHNPPPHVALPDHRVDTVKDVRFIEQSVASREISLDIEDLDIPWNELILKERIGAGSFGTVHRADWHGSDVAVKILMEQDFHAERFKEFLREVAIMKRLRHPNIVLFMGAVTQPPNLSIVTEYLSRGSLYRLLHKPGAREVLDERRRLNMAYDVAKGMNYLHRRNPPVVHRDLKSPNLLVDKKYTVKVCDFGLSRLKANTFLSSKSAAGTPEWMAPEVLRDEQSNEKSDVYSFGVILWELATLQQPWGNLNPAQVVAAVGFKGKRLEIPRDLNPQVASIIEACWANEPWKRPPFSSIMESLRPLIKPPTPPQVRADMPLLT